jgi:hypothetical protein
MSQARVTDPKANVAGLIEAAHQNNGLTIGQVHEILFNCSRTSVHDILKRNGFSYEKKKWMLDPNIRETLGDAPNIELVQPRQPKPFKPLVMQPHPRASELREVTRHTVGFQTPHYKD